VKKCVLKIFEVEKHAIEADPRGGGAA